MAIDQGYVYLKNSGFVNILNILWGALRLFESYNKKYNKVIPIVYNCNLWNGITDFYDIDYPDFKVHNLDYKTLNILNIKDAEKEAFESKKDLVDVVHETLATTLHFYKQYRIPPAVFFKKFKLKKWVVDKIIEIQNKLSNHYIGIHVRGGDYTFKYQTHEEFIKVNSQFIEQILREHKGKKILFCSDAQELIERYVDSDKICNFSIYLDLIKKNKKIPSGVSLHTSPNLMASLEVSEQSLCETTILDFYLLMFSKILYTNQHEYSTFAETLKNYNKYILDTNICLNQQL